MGFRVCGLGFRVCGLGFRAKSLKTVRVSEILARSRMFGYSDLSKMAEDGTLSWTVYMLPSCYSRLLDEDSNPMQSVSTALFIG